MNDITALSPVTPEMLASLKLSAMNLAEGEMMSFEPAVFRALVEALEKAQTERDEFRNRLKLERATLEDADKRIVEQARIIELLNEHGYEVRDNEINESNVFDAVELLLTQLIEVQETPSEYELVRGQLLIAHRTLLNQRAKIAELESRTVTVKLPALNDDLIAILGRPNFMCAHLAGLLRKSGEVIKRKSEHEQAAIIHWFLGIYLEHGEQWENVAKAEIQARAAGIQVIEGEGQ
mgnify:CR=1 FL=1